VIYPSAEQQAGFGKCFDTWSAAAKVRDGGSDPVSIASMVTYTEQHYSGDPNRVYATGSSSGGAMTDEMLALHPDVFKPAPRSWACRSAAGSTRRTSRPVGASVSTDPRS
jgi:poly(3-hydroxybutyrate) depolymerase